MCHCNRRLLYCTRNIIPGPRRPLPPAVERRHALKDLLWVEAPELLGADAVPEDAGEPQRHADLHRPEDYVVGVARRQVNPENGRETCLTGWSNRISHQKGKFIFVAVSEMSSYFLQDVSQTAYCMLQFPVICILTLQKGTLCRFT